MANTKAGSSKSNLPRLESWDPMLFVDEEPTPSCLMRVKRDIAEIKANPLPGIFISPEEVDLTRIHAIVVGPAGTPYEGGFFQFFIKCPANYPIVPPRVRLMTTDAGRVRFNPNLYANGKVCLSILGTWTGPAWSPVQTVGTVLISIQSLMNEEPIYNEPWMVCTSGASTQYNDKVRHNTIRVAVCDAVEACLRKEPPYPPYLVDAILKTFAETYDKYEQRVKALVEQNSSSWQLSRMFGLVSTYEYTPLLERLRQLVQGVKDKMEADGAAETQKQ